MGTLPRLPGASVDWINLATLLTNFSHCCMPLDDLPSHFIDLVHDALLKSFWRKNALLNFLRRHKISGNFLATWDESETKRVFVGRLLPKLEAHQKGSQILKQMAVSLADQ